MQSSLDHIHFPAPEEVKPDAVKIKRDDDDLTDTESRRIEANSLAAACVFVLAIAVDALSSLPAAGVADVPTSLRVSSLVLVSMVAAPPVEAVLLFEQRFGAALLLAAASGIALHSAELHARISDALYSLVGGWSVVGAYAKGGPRRRERGYDAKGQRENVNALAAALLGYAGMRIVRQGVFHASEAARFSMEHDDIATRGLAYADDLTATMLVFGGAVCVCALVVVIVNHDNIYDHGSVPVSSVMGMLAVLVFTAAFVAQISFYANVEQLDAVFGYAACEGGEDVCAASIRARRMYVANGSPATLWACAVGMVLFAFPHARRCRTRYDYHHGPDDETVTRYNLHIDHAAYATGWVSALSALVAVIVVLSFTDAESTLRCVELLLLYGSIPIAWFGTSWIATAVHAAGLLLHVIDKTGSPFGFDLNYYTHWCVLLTLLLLLVLTVTMAIAGLLYASWCSQWNWIDWIDVTTALALVALVSVQLHLTLCSLSITASFGGSNVVLGAVSWPAFGMQWSSQHCLSFFFAAALAGARYEPQHPWLARALSACDDDCEHEREESEKVRRSWLGPRALRIFWFGTPLLAVVAWIVAMASIQTGLPYAQAADMSSIVVAWIGAVVPWAIIGAWLC